MAIHVGDTTRFWLTITDEDGGVVDITGGTIAVRLAKPSGTTVEKTGSVSDGPAGIALYDAPSTDLDVEGRWRIQAIVTLSGKTYHSDIDVFDVLPNLVVT